jgi:hypothetical protein
MKPTTFRKVPIDSSFLFKDQSGEYYGWRKYDANRARKETPNGLVYGWPPVYFPASAAVVTR